ncbi:MAG: response regulator [Candidatus Aminicenantes bacterium]|nr:response regulator [Candidatus Aminicenantes bacterium]
MVIVLSKIESKQAIRMSEKKILIVDYDSKNLERMNDLFAPYKLTIVEATDGQMAYDKYLEEKPDLIILEAMLPKLHGFDLTQKIYSETKGSIPIIIVTGLYKGAQYKNEALRSFGAADYFEKPFDDKQLVNSVMNLLSDEIDIEDELPDPDTVIGYLSQMYKKKAPSQKEEKS